MSAIATAFGVWVMHVQRWRALYLGEVRLEAAVQSPRFHVFRNQPLSPEDVKGEALLGGPKVPMQDFACFCNIYIFLKDNETGRASRNSSALRDSQHFSPDFAKHSQAVPVCELQPVKELLIETAPDQKPCPTKFIPDLWTANSKEIKNTPNCVRATPIYAGVRGSWPDSCAGRRGHANKVG